MCFAEQDVAGSDFLLRRFLNVNILFRIYWTLIGTSCESERLFDALKEYGEFHISRCINVSVLSCRGFHLIEHCLED